MAFYYSDEFQLEFLKLSWAIKVLSQARVSHFSSWKQIADFVLMYSFFTPKKIEWQFLDFRAEIKFSSWRQRAVPKILQLKLWLKLARTELNTTF